MESLPRTQLVGCFGRLQLQKVRFLFYFIFFGQKVRRGESKCWDGKMDGWEGKEAKEKKKAAEVVYYYWRQLR